MPNTKATTNTVKNMESVLSNGAMALRTSENSIITIFMVRVFTLGQTTESTKENGDQIKCMVKVLLHGLMGENM